MEKGLMRLIFSDFIEDYLPDLGFPVTDDSNADRILPNFNPSSSSSGVDLRLAHVSQCA
jgi:hypothetical protein